MSQKFEIKKAARYKAWGRLGICGLSGSGKTYSALSIATEFVHMGWATKIMVIDSEQGSAQKYATPGPFDFHTIELKTFAPLTYVDAINAAVEAGYDFIIIDSLSHAWMGKEGALEQVEMSAKRSQTNNKFGGWRDVTPMHNALIDALVGPKAHICATMRMKTEHVVEDVDGKKKVRKVGLAPVQRDGMEYEFDVVLDMNRDHEALVSKTRCEELDAKFFLKPGKDFAKIFGGWLSGQEAPPKQKTEEEVEAEVVKSLIDDPDVKKLFDELKTPEAKRIAGAEKFKTKDELMAALNKRMAEAEAEKVKEAERAAKKDAKKETTSSAS